MSEQGAVEAYLRMIEGVGDRADAMGPRLIASHWPFVGSDYQRLLVVSQALAGWDDKTSTALWMSALAKTADGRQAIVAGTRAYATALQEPMTVPLRTRAHSPFWSLSKRTVQLLEPGGPRDWYSRFAWWNLFPLGWGDTNRSPWFDQLWDAQLPQRLLGRTPLPRSASTTSRSSSGRCSRAVSEAAERLCGRITRASHLKGVSRPSFAAAIAAAIREMVVVR